MPKRTFLPLGPTLLLGLLAACSDPTSLPAPPTSPSVSPPLTDESNAGADDADEVRGRVFTTIDVPGGTFQGALDINDEGAIVGRYMSGPLTFGYIRERTGQFTTIQYPGAPFTVAAGINDRGDVVGHYSLPQDIRRGKPAIRHGFLFSQGTYTSFDPPSSIRTNVLGIDERGDIAGRYVTAAKWSNSGFLLRHGEFIAPIDYPNATETHLWKTTRDGRAVGGYAAVDGTNHLFLWENGNFTTIDLPGMATIGLDKGNINPRGDIVGTYCPAPRCNLNAPITPISHGFLLTRHHRFTSFDFPNAHDTDFFGVNARGDIVGAYTDAQGASHGLLLSGPPRHDK
ncbi:MAG: hypothetical protein NVS4B3_20750 [Gemmatimonadaceae bacterium]